MVVFFRKMREEIVVGGIDGTTRQLKVTVLEIEQGSVCLGIELAADEALTESRRNPDIRALIATLWRNRSALRSGLKVRSNADAINPEDISEGAAHAREECGFSRARSAKQMVR